MQFYPVLCLCGVHRYSIPGGYSSKAIRPIALAKVMSIAQMMKAEFPGSDFSLSGIGGVETGNDAAEFILLGANTVQVCTGVMLHGYGHVKSLCKDLQAFMSKYGFTSIEDFQGASLDYFTTHVDLVKQQKEAVEKKQKVRKGLASDKDWTGEGLAKETETMVSN
jgi:dihydropyrimidine dehydrogenase (NADP+)